MISGKNLVKYTYKCRTIKARNNKSTRLLWDILPLNADKSWVIFIHI